MSKQQHYGIKFPFNIKSDENTFVDLNLTEPESIKSQIMHLIFTPVGQRLRQPLFGSKLIQFIFNPNDGQTWGDVIMEIKDMVKKYIPNCNIDNVDVYETDNGLGLVAKITYTISSNSENKTYQIITNL